MVVVVVTEVVTIIQVVVITRMIVVVPKQILPMTQTLVAAVHQLMSPIPMWILLTVEMKLLT